MDIDAVLRGISIWALPVVLAVVLHEVAHGRMADLLGDDTARKMGRLTLNPFKHMDPVGTVLIPILLIAFQAPFLFGYAKPVPVNFNKLRSPRRDMVWVALAGPITNLILALLSTLLLFIVLNLPDQMRWLAEPLSLMCQASIIINMILFLFNLLPIPPLDGGRVAVGLLPHNMAYQLARLEPYGFLILIVLLLSGALEQFFPMLMASSHWLIGLAIPL